MDKNIRETILNALKVLVKELEGDDKEIEMEHMKRLAPIIVDLQSIGARFDIRDFIYIRNVLNSSYNIVNGTIENYPLEKDENMEIKNYVVVGLEKLIEALEGDEVFEDGSKNVINEKLFMEAHKNLVVETWMIHKSLVFEGRQTKEELEKDLSEKED
jgi:hypothetical protein